MQELEGQITDIIYKNEVNGYTVCEFYTEEFGNITIVGYLPFISNGDSLKIIGKIVTHKEYGEQFKVESFEKIMPKTLDGLINYLGSGMIKGVGPATAKRIVKKFGDETMYVMKMEPERLAEVKGITSKRAIEICEEFSQKWDLWELVSFLEKYGISASNAQKVYKELGPDAIQIIESNPYILIDIVYNVDFQQIDQMAIKIGINADFNKRIEAGIKYALVVAGTNGNTCVIKENLIEYVSTLLKVERNIVENELINCKANDVVVVQEFDEQEWVFLKEFNVAETNVATKILEMMSRPNTKKLKNFDNQLREAENESSIELSEMQLTAIKTVNENNITIITGGPRYTVKLQ